MIAGDVTCDKFFTGQQHCEQLSLVTTTPVITFFPSAVDTGQKYQKTPKIYCRCQRHCEKLFSGVNDTPNKTMLKIPACLDLKIKNKQKFNLQEQSALK
jgi:hypothetical protein